MLVSDKVDFITNWILNYTLKIPAQPVALVIGISGGVDSAVSSTLSAKTGLKTIAVSMPIKQNPKQHDLSIKHLRWLEKNFSNVTTSVINLDNVFESFKELMNSFDNELAFANSRSRLRMITLYQIAQYSNGIVVGTGNKIEDFGVGFFTKYGDGGVDISPLADCTKTDVWKIAEELNILKDIIDAPPTDGLWEDSRNDETQLGLTYKQIEEAMENSDSQYFKKYNEIRKKNLHKMLPIPVCEIKDK
ncbi:MAG: NH(3)-dependent NAD(+) synthetase [Alphaproteobacteria bacterium MarineAlpha5_Bin6]|mgnify:CR=1 FL=1|nr:MAG: NH(3)-dependent NAD(+) synthetase [Alphaproteobacteria bacterium MarineAlpha5_Bin7]PPR53991.1 MAG: NH(3)-dependent NAD(+) synthetase [Alphaproteobacteria bacterium MarineAlpha5_Bin6]|tara:strand:+ start:2607 stop:3347 length:741 start_codon:yes stop_codon:yes gene_type:complete